MKPGAGKRKGSQWERDFCKMLSLWWTDGADKDVFWRTSGSGCRHGIREECGDVSALKPSGVLLMNAVMIELKCWNEDDLLLDVIRGAKKSKLREAWCKCSNEALAHHKFPFMVVKISNKTTICLFNKNQIACCPDDAFLNYCCFLYPPSGTCIMEWGAFIGINSLFNALKSVLNDPTNMP